MENKGTVHIGLPVLNGEDYLAQSLDSLLAQTYENFQLYIVDNLSTDATESISRAYAKRDKRIKYIRQAVLGSWLVNWSRTWEIAAPGSRFFMWASDDDLWAPDYIESLLSPLVENPKVVLSFSEANEVNEEGRTVCAIYRKRFPKGRTAIKRIRSIIRCGRYSAIYGLFRTTAANWTPILTETSFGSDLWFLLRLAACGNFYIVNRPLFFKRIGGISQTGVDPSAIYDPLKSWNIGDKEWELIGELNLPWFTRLDTYYRLKFFGKTVYPQDKKIDWFLLPLFWSYMVWKNSRSLGIRSRLKKRLFSSCGWAQGK